MSASLTRLRSFYSEFRTPLLLHATIKREFPGSVAVVTSFGPDAGLLLAMVAEIEPNIPVLFPNSSNQPPLLLDYARRLERELGLTRMRWLSPTTEPGGGKAQLSEIVEEMGMLAIITARQRSGLPKVELDDNGIFRINPLAGWPKEEQNEEINKRTLARYPLANASEMLELDDGQYNADEVQDATLSNWSV